MRSWARRSSAAQCFLVGAISVLILFAVMLTQSKSGPARLVFHYQAWAAGIASVIVGLLLIMSVVYTTWPAGDADAHRAERRATSPRSSSGLRPGVRGHQPAAAGGRRSAASIWPGGTRIPTIGSRWTRSDAHGARRPPAGGGRHEPLARRLPLLAGPLFAIGTFGSLPRRNAIAMLMSIELMLNAVNLAIVAFGGVHARAGGPRRRSSRCS